MGINKIKSIQWTGTGVNQRELFNFLTNNTKLGCPAELEGENFWIDLNNGGCQVGTLMIKTVGGDVKADIGDYIIRDVDGHFYPSKINVISAVEGKSEEELLMSHCGDTEIGKCSICGLRKQLDRTTYRYGIPCECHSPSHFVTVSHCGSCIPKEPVETKVLFSTKKLKKLIMIDVDKFEHLLNCMCNQKYIMEQSEETQKDWQDKIDIAYDEARQLISKMNKNYPENPKNDDLNCPNHSVKNHLAGKRHG